MGPIHCHDQLQRSNTNSESNRHSDPNGHPKSNPAAHGNASANFDARNTDTNAPLSGHDRIESKLREWLGSVDRG
jgi:hypothetical protein